MQQPKKPTPPPPEFVDVRGRTGALLARYDPATQQLEVRCHGRTEVVDLKRYHAERWGKRGCVAEE